MTLRIVRLAAAAALSVVATGSGLAAQALASNARSSLEASNHASHASAAGLIVKLRDAPTNARALNTGATQADAARRAAAHAERVRRAVAGAGLGSARQRPVGRAAQLLDFGRLLSAGDAQRMAEQLRRQPEVEWVVTNDREQRQQVPDDPYFAATAGSNGQWWLRPISGSSANVLADRLRGVPGLQSAWALSGTGNGNAVVAVLDTGITAHPELGAQVLPGYDFVSDLAIASDGDGRDADPSDPGDSVSQSDKDSNPALFAGCDVQASSWHGTVIAGIVAAGTDNGIGVAGINWAARVLPVRVAGKCGAEVADIVDAMRWAAGLPVAGAQPNPNPARIVNISFGGSAACNAAYQEAIDELAVVGTVVVAAAGNGHGNVKRPASCARVIGVAALNRDGFKANYSNFGPEVAVSTVGGDPAGEGLWGALLGDDGLLTLDNLGLRAPEGATYGNHFGTSFAAPVVAGVLSLMLDSNPSLSVAELIDGVRRSARPHVTSSMMAACSALNPGRCTCTPSTCGAGILDAPQALQYALDPVAWVAPARLPEDIDSSDLRIATTLGTDLPPNESATEVDSGGGGGTLDPAWLALLAGCVLALGQLRRESIPCCRARNPCPVRAS